MRETFLAWGGVAILAVASLPVVVAVAWSAVRLPRWRVVLCDIGIAVGTAPWLWMILTPNGSGRSLHLLPLRDLADVLAENRTMEQIGGNLLVFAALGILAPLRHPWFTRPHRVLLTAATASLAVEAAQFALSIGRHSSIDDILLNATGAYLFTLLTNTRAIAAGD